MNPPARPVHEAGVPLGGLGGQSVAFPLPKNGLPLKVVPKGGLEPPCL